MKNLYHFNNDLYIKTKIVLHNSNFQMFPVITIYSFSEYLPLLQKQVKLWMLEAAIYNKKL